jgi:hypothetical protein
VGREHPLVVETRALMRAKMSAAGAVS